MIYISDYFAIALVLILCLFYFDSKRPRAFFDKASKYFVFSLLFTAVTTLTDIIAVELLYSPGTPCWLNMFINSLYFIFNIIATSFIALYLFTKILEHTYDDHCMRNARKALAVLFTVYTAVVVSNPWTGLLFSFEPSGSYIRGPLNVLGYVVTLCQMVLVLICYGRNRKNADRVLRRVLIQVFPVVAVCIVIQRVYPEIMLNGIIMAMVLTVLFLTFQGQRQGVHSLTKLNDRHRFFKDMEERIAAGERFQVFRINLKDFGVINQKYGHLLGDEVLYQFAFALEKLIRSSMAFHMNGTIFALAIPFGDEAAAKENRSRLLQFLEEGIVCMGDTIRFDYVLVEYLSGEREGDAKEFYEKLEYATQVGLQRKNRYLCYTPEIGEQMHRTRYLVERLRKVDREHGYRVWYQPIHCLKSGKYCSMEALVRLEESDGSMISPAEFIPVAEQTGLITQITWFVVEEVCRFLSQSAPHGVSISVNIPMTQLQEENFCEKLVCMADRYGVDHSRLCLEFTERAILENFAETKQVMEEVSRSGFRFYLDDFGTGYSNFNCLLQLPFQVIKLDASLTRLLGKEGKEAHPLVSTLTGLFHRMGLTVVAEGAETPEDVSRLAQQGVDRIQGFVYARPMPEEELLQFYRTK